MEIEKIREELKVKLGDAERVLIGLGAEWKVKEADREELVMNAKESLHELVDGKDYFVISTMSLEELNRLGFESAHTVAPLDVSLTEEQWNGYTDWLSRTLNKKLVILELGEGFMHPSIMRWPFEKTVAINNKAYMFRVHKTFYQISDEIKEKATAVKADSVEFVAQLK